MQANRLSPKVVYEDKNLVVLNKPAGLLVHEVKVRTVTKSEPTLADWLVKHYPSMKKVGDDPKLRPGIVHRLDKDTSGVMLAAKTKKSFEYLKSLFQKREVRKKYLAVVWGRVEREGGRIDAPIGIKTGSVKRKVRSGKLEKEAVTDYKTLRVGEEKSFLRSEVTLERKRARYFLSGLFSTSLNR